MPEPIVQPIKRFFKNLFKKAFWQGRKPQVTAWDVQTPWLEPQGKKARPRRGKKRNALHKSEVRGLGAAACHRTMLTKWNPTISARGKTKEKAGPGTRIASRLSLVPVAGLEPARCRHRWILSPLRLPIPSHRQVSMKSKIYYTTTF